MRAVRRLVLAGTVLVTLPLAAQRPHLSDQVKQRYVAIDTAVVAITGVTVIDGRGGPAQSGQTVVIRDGKIVAVGSGVAVPAGAYTIDGTGKTLIPGLVGMHDHMFYTAAGGFANQMSFTAPKLYLASGVTTIRTTGGRSPYAELNSKATIDSGLAAGPRIHVTTPYLTGSAGGGAMFATDDPVAARRFVAYWASEGVEWVKFYTDIPRAAMKAAIDEAHKHGMKATGHLCSVTFSEAIDLGLDDFAHGAITATDFYPGKTVDKCPTNSLKVVDSLAGPDSPVAKALIAKMVKSGRSMTTTMPIYEALYPKRPVRDERSLELMAPQVRTAYLASRDFIDSSSTYVFTTAGFTRLLAFDKAFYEAGGLLANGVDPTGNGGALPGFGDQRGYELLREAGLGPEQAVQVVTLNGAKILGVAKSLGSVEVGKTADLVLLDGDLRSDPSVIRKVVTVFKSGVGYDPKKLIDAVRGRVGID